MQNLFNRKFGANLPAKAFSSPLLWWWRLLYFRGGFFLWRSYFSAFGKQSLFQRANARIFLLDLFFESFVFRSQDGDFAVCHAQILVNNSPAFLPMRR